MSCAACSSRVEKAASSVPGVESCQVNLLTKSMLVSGEADPTAIIAAVEEAGYGAALPSAAPADGPTAASPNPLEDDREARAIKRRLCWSFVFLLALIYLADGHPMWGWPLPHPWNEAPLAQGLAQLLLSAIVLLINHKFFLNGAKGLIHLAPNMDTLVAMGSGISFLYSTGLLFAMTVAELSRQQILSRSLYFESAAMILVFISIGKYLEERAKYRTTSALRELIALTPTMARVSRQGEYREIPIDQVRRDDLFLVKAGEQIPADGVITQGQSSLDESSLNGESLPRDKGPGDEVFTATINLTGPLHCRATRVGSETILAQIISMVSEAVGSKAPIARLADRVAAYFVPIVIALSALTVGTWLLLGQNWSWALTCGIAVLVISCPCSLGLATPVAIMVGSGLGAKYGILFKDAIALEKAGSTQIVACDKTGTLTTGQFQVSNAVPAPKRELNELLQAALDLETLSEHPLARAICAFARTYHLEARKVESFGNHIGHGISAIREGQPLWGGSPAFIEGHCPLPESARESAQRLAEAGQTVVTFADAKGWLGHLALADGVKSDSRTAVAALKELGLRVVMLTGDNQSVAQNVGRELAIDEVRAELLPQHKGEIIAQLQDQAPVAFVGDGINDAPALAKAGVSFAMGSGADIAHSAASIVILPSRLSDVVRAIKLSRATLRTIKQNLFWAFFYNILAIPIAAGILTPWCEYRLSPSLAALAMSLSSFCVVSNALRLRWADLRVHGADSSPATAKDTEEKHIEVNAMQKTMHIEGMMCGHCEARVKKTLEAIEGVRSAIANHTEGTAVVTLETPVADEVLKKAIEAQDYQVTSIE